MRIIFMQDGMYKSDICFCYGYTFIPSKKIFPSRTFPKTSLVYQWNVLTDYVVFYLLAEIMVMNILFVNFCCKINMVKIIVSVMVCN